MELSAKIAVGIVALIHIVALVIEMCLWSRLGPVLFKKFPPEQFNKLACVLAFNQGAYNGFLAAGLVWSIFASPAAGISLAWFFLICVFIAGLVGGFTASKKILVVQSLFAAIAGAVLLWNPSF